MEIQIGKRLFDFHSEANWVAKAPNRYGACGLPLHLTIAIDTKGRVCSQGGHFMRATAENAYPITVYALRPDVEPAT